MREIQIISISILSEKMFLIFNTKKIWPWKNASMIKKKDNFSHFTSYFEEYGFTK